MKISTINIKFIKYYELRSVSYKPGKIRFWKHYPFNGKYITRQTKEKEDPDSVINYQNNKNNSDDNFEIRFDFTVSELLPLGTTMAISDSRTK